MSDATRTAQTYRYERWRAISSGILETAGSTFLLLIAVRWFHAGALSKALVAGGGSFGLMLGPWLVARVETGGWPVARAASRVAAVGAIGFVAMALVPVLPVYVIGAVITMAASSAAVPLMTQIYQENYPQRERGKLFSRTFMIRIATAAVFSELAGRFLTGNLELFRWLLVVFAAAFALTAFCFAEIPSRPLTASGGTHPFRALRFVRDDALFRRTLIMWMLMGFANLMILPLRVEYLANPKHGVTWHGAALTTAQIALLVGVIPNLARLVMSPIWGRLFDHMNFFVLRIVLNLGFALGMLSFFGGDHIAWLVLGAIIYGVSNAGGDVAWGLWVTKFAPPERVADYMSVHTFFTGLRGVIAPVAAFWLIEHFSLTAISWLGAIMIVFATLLLIPEIKFGKAGRRAAALTEEVSE
ncbi:MAG TPA: MFS transporter [Verrucomicrobiae bacterium]|nr:MFS transporter [Verrucomicrobiae bacterium]